MGWILTGEGLHHDAAVLTKYCPDLCRDRVHVFLSTWHWTSNVLVGLALLALGGVPYVLWGIFFRDGVRPSLHLAGELGDAPVGLAPVHDA
jgi:stearoyl-CoA desaturase (delta-9 desaturase)